MPRQSVFSGMFASRRNYDVAQGTNAQGSGARVFWSNPGASAAPQGPRSRRLEAFRADPGLQVVHASTFEIYGESEAPPPHATVYFRGVDERVGSLTKYTVVEAHGDTR